MTDRYALACEASRLAATRRHYRDRGQDTTDLDHLIVVNQITRTIMKATEDITLPASDVLALTALFRERLSA